MTTDRPTPSKPRRRWFQYSLRTLLVLVTVLCVWLAVTVNRARKQRETMASIRELGGEVYYVREGPKWLLELVGEEYFVSVDGVQFVRTKVTDAGLVHLKDLTKLEYLCLIGTEVTDPGLVHLKALTKLQTLNLYNTKVTDAGLVHLEGLTNLQFLDIRNTQVTDEGVQKLQQALPNCKIIR